MSTKIASAIITFLINVAVGIVIFAGLIIAMNGYSESDAMWGLCAFIVLALGVSVLMSLGAYFTAGILINRQFGPVSSSLISIVVFSFLGGSLKFVCSLIGVGVAELVRVNF